MSIVWPSTLPTTLQVGSTETPIDRFVENAVDVGSPKRRLRFSGGPMGEIAGTLTLTQDQMNTFDTFFETTLAGGSLPFQWIRPSTGATVYMRFLSKKPTRKTLTPTLYQVPFAVRFDPS